MSRKVNVGDLVWAKMGRCKPWPGRVAKPRQIPRKPNKKTETHCIYFFGTGNYAWIDEDKINPYLEFKTQYRNICKTVLFKKSLADIEEFIKNKEENPNYELCDDESDDDTKSVMTVKSVRSLKRKRTESSYATKRRIQLLDKILNTSTVDTAEDKTIDLSSVSDKLKSKDVQPSTLALGFLGLGIMGSRIVKNLVNSGHKVNVWTRSHKKAEIFKSQAEELYPGCVSKCDSPSDLVHLSDIIFSCLSDADAVKDIVYGNCGVLFGLDSLHGKGYVEMTNIDSETSAEICKSITDKGGRYLEAQLQGSRREADSGELIILAAGDKSLFADCNSSFTAIGKTVFLLGDAGLAIKMNCVLQLMKAVSLVGLAEALALADRSGLDLTDVMEIFSITSIRSPLLQAKGELMLKSNFDNVEQPLQHMQKDLRYAMQMANALNESVSVTSAANEVLKHSRRLGYDSYDVASVYMETPLRLKYWFK